MRLARSVAAATIALLMTAAPAAAQTDVGGSVPSMLALQLDDPSGLAVHAHITSTAYRAFVSVADGDIGSGPPLEAKVGSGPFEPLDAGIDPVLAEFGPVANERVTIRLQPRGERSGGTYTKTLLITLSASGP